MRMSLVCTKYLYVVLHERPNSLFIEVSISLQNMCCLRGPFRNRGRKTFGQLLHYHFLTALPKKQPHKLSAAAGLRFMQTAGAKVSKQAPFCTNKFVDVCNVTTAFLLQLPRCHLSIVTFPTGLYNSSTAKNTRNFLHHV